MAKTSKKVETAYTKLIDKHYSPLVIRKYTHWGFPIYVGIITDNNLSDLDDKVLSFMKTNKEDGWVNDIDKVRQLAGRLTEYVNDSYDKTEGVAVVMAVDKCMISSLHGDFMNHGQCKLEFYQLLNLSAHI